MRGILYAGTEIVVFLLIATLIGIVIGRMWSAATRRPDAPAQESADAKAKSELAEARQRLAAVEAERADLAKQLSVVEWQVETLEEELAKSRPAEADAE